MIIHASDNPDFSSDRNNYGLFFNLPVFCCTSIARFEHLSSTKQSFQLLLFLSLFFAVLSRDNVKKTVIFSRIRTCLSVCPKNSSLGPLALPVFTCFEKLSTWTDRVFGQADRQFNLGQKMDTVY